jgi:hypothetical protein
MLPRLEGKSLLLLVESLLPQLLPPSAWLSFGLL